MTTENKEAKTNCFRCFDSICWQNIILIVTACAAAWIGFLQNEINRKTEEESIRPVILRSNTIPGWSSIKDGKIDGQLFVFKVQKNIATDIEGLIVLEKRKYDFLFGYGVGSIGQDGRFTCTIPSLKDVGWVGQDNFLCAEFDQASSTMVVLPNQIYLSYKDIDGNSYYTKEDFSFIQTSNKI